MKTLFRNLKILLLCIVAIALISLLSAAVIYLFVAGISNQWIWSSIILFVFIIVIWFLKWRVDWKHGGIIILVITAFFGSMADMRGNQIYNEPIRLFYRDLGKLEVLTQSTTINGTTGTNYYFNIINASGHVVKHIPIVEVIIFRFFEYLILYAIVLSILVPFFKLIRKIGRRIDID
ncbi:hypothetical protein [Liquorilactobacillus hordei]|uniref:Uncharacterized protein n=1 Tax=Liquorilactobacillus hordei TaxID=468911 RepID=A0A3Q8CMS7_9LACO|nr:hypothetical protein [Liquorilactobacillus hordei]AUJ30736.1 hypothetical protein BSQ49_11400 [Liquorilactobacillus hordei]MBZ2406029.1 hypothetical protein [Liquorilactobacillus hordei]